MNSDILIKPTRLSGKYKDWLMWPDNYTVKDINMHDCNDTTTGVCYKNKSLEQCLDITSTTGSSFGYYLQNKNNSRDSICVPLRISNSSIYNNIYDVTGKGIYSQLKDMKSTVFMNSSVFHFPSMDSNIVMYNDKVSLFTEDDQFMYISGILNDKTPIRFGKKEEPQIISIIPNVLSSIKDKAYTHVLYGDDITFSIVGTTLLPVYDNYKFVWKISNRYTGEKSFVLHPYNNEKKKLGDSVYYGESFYMTHNDIAYCKIENGILNLEYDEEKKTIFKFIPKFNVYYCNSQKSACERVDIDKTTRGDGPSAYYENSAVYRDKDCFGICSYINDKDISSIIDTRCKKEKCDQLSAIKNGGGSNNDGDNGEKRNIIGIVIAIIILIVMIIIILYDIINIYRKK